ncbi:hypothetical protein AQ490_06055 [Wenjunlia vitaminophila]|uniref:DUF2637 domain-containing protein n=1 Tax=Wenjunlia vitaminophila TaxID=76728 RepID=A0A0T6LNP6_WENVI|nr:DUF2637 domain-containing protein [Wenjunlia vitaminophila]KRV47471.1 hypothetical protein AQ490_06055 [Wenjunlia vitaminophila]
MTRTPKALLVLALVGVVGMAFRVSWNALRDIARTVGADPTAATLYPFVVDGLMALALVATLVLTDPADKRFALRVLAAYTVASLVLNYVHGLVPALHDRSVDWGRLADWAPANWALVLLATSLPVGSIYFGSDLVAKVLHHRPTATTTTDESPRTRVNQSIADEGRSTPSNPTALGGESGAPGPEPSLVGVDSPPPVDVDSTDPAPTPAPAESASVESTPAGKVRPATGPVPPAARTRRPTRTPTQLLDEARQATVDWPTDALTAEAIRKAVRTSADNARTLRDALKAERAATAPERLHVVPAPDDTLPMPETRPDADAMEAS